MDHQNLRIAFVPEMLTTGECEESIPNVWSPEIKSTLPVGVGNEGCAHDSLKE